MNELEREAWIQQLNAERDEVLRNMEERRRRREEDPFYDAPHSRKASPRQNDSGGLMYRTHVNNPPLAAPETRDEPLGAPPPADDDDKPLDDPLHEAIAEALAGVRRDLRDEFDAKLAARDAALRERIAVLEGKVETLTSLFAGIGKSADVLSLPGGKQRA
jgi:hypothetical protein